MPWRTSVRSGNMVRQQNDPGAASTAPGLAEKPQEAPDVTDRTCPVNDPATHPLNEAEAVLRDLAAVRMERQADTYAAMGVDIAPHVEALRAEARAWRGER